MENRKRKREPETGAPRIKYHVEQLGRSFERILKENSHEELREVVRKKLDLSGTTRLELVQLREGRLYDLEDDDDFEAFKAAAIEYSSLDVRVSFSPQDSSGTTGHPNGLPVPGSTDLHKNRPTVQKKVSTVSKQTSKELVPKPSTSKTGDIQSIAHTSGEEEDMPAPPKKKRKTDSTKVAVEKSKVTSKSKKKDLKGKDEDVAPIDQEGGQEPPKKKQEKSKVLGAGVASRNVEIFGAEAEAASTEKNLTSKTKKPPKAKNAVPAVVDTDPEPPKKKQKKSKEAETVVPGRDVVTSAVPAEAATTGKASAPEATKVSKARDTVAVGRDAEPLKKKQQKSKEAESGAVPRDEATSVVPVEEVSMDKKKPKGKTKKAAVEAEGKRMKKKDVQTSDSDMPAPDAPPPERTSSASTTTSVVSDNAKKSRTIEELLIASKALPETEPKKSSKMTKAKAPAKPPVGKSRLSESWTPGNSEESSSPGTETSSTTPSGLAHPPLSNLAATHPPLVKPAVATSTTAHDPAFTSVAPVSVPIVPVAVTDVAPVLTPAATTSLPVVASHIGPNPGGTPKSSGKKEPALPCPVCLARPFHHRFLCPTILLGGSAIQKRIDGLKSEGGQEELVEELCGWLRRVTKGKMAGKSPKEIDVRDNPGLDKTPLQGSIAAGRRDSHVTVHEWTSVRPREGRLSEVTVENRDEGSDAEDSSDSDSSSGSENVTDPEDKKLQPNVDSEPDSDSSSDSSSGSSSDSRPDLKTKSPSIDLERADLEEIMRGPAVKVQLAKLAVEDENDSSEEGTSLLEEEDEGDEKRRRSAGNWKVTRSSSPEAMDEDYNLDSEAIDQDYNLDSEAASDLKESSAVHQVKDSSDEGDVKESTKEVAMVPGNLAAETEVVPSEESEPRPNELHPSSMIQEVDEVAVDAEKSVGERPKTPPTENPSQLSSATRPPKTPVKGFVERASISVIKSPTTPARSSTAQTIIRSPLVRQMKDRSGNLPLNPPDDEEESELPIVPTAHDNSTVTAEEEIEQSKRGRSRTPSQAKSTTRSTRSRSRTTGPAAATSSTPPAAAPKRRGRPPLTDAVKAERQAIKEAERAAREAAKQERQKAAGKAPKKTAKPDAVHSEHVAPPEDSTPNHSQEKMLPSSTVSSSVPTVDRSVPNIAVTKVNQHHVLATAAIPGGVDGIKSPGAISVTTSASRMHDEDDVEQIVGSPKASIKENMDASMQRSLFLPGASQMTQTQSIPNFFKRNMEERAQFSPDSQAGSGSSSLTEEESGEDEKTPQKPTISHSSLPSKSAFPSLSQLSFDKFRPSFLLPTRGLSQKKQDEQQQDEESDSEEEDSSDEDNNSHVPKDRIAGTGIANKRKSRGLLDV